MTAQEIANIYVPDDPTANQMVAEAIQLFIAFLPFYTLASVFQYYYQAIAALWLVFPLNAAAYLLTIFFITCRHCGRITFRLEDYLLLPDDFGIANNRQLDITVTSKGEVLGLSERTQNFCESKGIDAKRSMFAGICIEEMAGNIVDYGFDDGKDHFVDVRVIIKGEQVIIRLRDDCRPFDPKKQVEIYNPEDPAAHIGIRLCKKISTEFNYVNALKLNNLIIKI